MESVIPICRVCLNVCDEGFDFQKPFKLKADHQMENAAATINYLQCLRLCTNLPIDEHDEGPQCLCRACEDELQVVYKFIKKARNSQVILEENFHNNKETTEISIVKLKTAGDMSEDDAFLVKPQLGDNCYESVEMNEKQNILADLVADNTRKLKDDAIEQKEYMSTEDSLQSSRIYTRLSLLKTHLIYHKRKYIAKNPFSCKLCDEVFSLQHILTRHMREHANSQDTHECEQCNKNFSSKTALISHKRIHQGRTLNCGECGKQFFGSYELKIHESFHKREKELQNNKCQICFKEFSLQRYLSQHMIVHADHRVSYKCSYCDKVYISKTALNNHKRFHEGKTLACQECGKKFTRNCELKIHMRFHKREYPYECTMCDKKFIIKGHLKAHMWQHQGIKLECEECGKLFSSTKALNEHSYTHGEMPYHCAYCGKAYPSRQKHKNHLKKFHSGAEQEIDILQLSGVAISGETLKKRKNFNYVHIIENHELNCN